MKPCGWSGGHCPHEAVVTVRIAGVGDRAVCQDHHDWIVANAMDFRVIDPNAPMPVWRTRTLSGQQRLLGIPR